MTHSSNEEPRRYLNMRDTPSSFLAYADAYLSAANLLVPLKNQLNEIFETGPVYQLTGQSLELTFKAMLLHKGVRVEDLSKPRLFGHDLLKLREKLEGLYDIRSIVQDTNLQQAELYFKTNQQEFNGLSLEEASDLMRFDWQLLALNENYYSFTEETKLTYRSRYPRPTLDYKPVFLSILLPCIDTLRDFAYNEVVLKKT